MKKYGGVGAAAQKQGTPEGAQHIHYNTSPPALSIPGGSNCVDFSLLQQKLICNLYNFPTCKMTFSVISYRHKEVIPMYM